MFLNDEHVLRIIDRIITPLGRRIDETSPRVDARLPDGSRVNAIIEPLSLIGPVITVRKFAARPYTVDDLIRFGTASPEMFDFLRACIEARLNVFVSGGTGSGKTTTLNVLSSFIPNGERIVTIEDAAELQLRQDHVLTLEARPANLEGEGEITIRDLLRNAMHMRPDRIIVGECRSGEALDMLQAMTTGHDGSLSTGHANSPDDMLRRLETMVLMTGYELPLRAIREQIASAVDLIVHTARLKDGSRKVTQHHRDLRDRGRRDPHPGHLRVRADGPRRRARSRAISSRPASGRRSWPSSRSTASSCRPASSGSRPRIAPNPAHGHADEVPLGRRRGRERRGTATSARARPVVAAGGMVYVTTVGPVDPTTGAWSGPAGSRSRPPVPAQPQGAARGSTGARSTRSSGRTGASATRPTSTPSATSGTSGSRATRRSGRAR